jgi:ribosomal protein S18 acetylase RimI-like enzyme
MIEIREYRETDAPRMISLIRELQAHEVALYERMKPVADMGHWYIDLLKKRCAKDSGTILIAEENGTALGYATILTNVIEDGKADELAYTYAHVGDLVVSEVARRRGIGKLLLEECERRSRAAGRDELRIAVLANNEGAYQTYRSFGFDDHSIKMRKTLK